MSIELVGSLGIGLIEASYVSQLVRLYRIKHADEISLLFPLLNFLGRLCALVYAMNIGSGVFILGFAIGLTLRGTLMGQVIYYRWIRPKSKQEPA